MKLSYCLALCAAGLCAYVTNAAATEKMPDVPRVVVSFTDLNLNHPAGIKALYGRLKGATSSVCPEVTQRDLKEFSRYKTCRAEALQRAIAAIDNPLLTRYAAERSGARPVAMVQNRR